VIGGKCLGYFAMWPETYPMVHGSSRSDIIHGSQVVNYVFLFVCLSFRKALFSNFAKGYRQEFSTYQAEIVHQQSPRSSLNPFFKFGGWDPSKGFSPLKTPQLTKKSCSWPREVVWSIFPMVKKMLLKKCWTRDTPSGAVDQNVRKNFGKNSKSIQLAAEIDRSVARALLDGRCHASLTDFCCMMRTTVANN